MVDLDSQKQYIDTQLTRRQRAVGPGTAPKAVPDFFKKQTCERGFMLIDSSRIINWIEAKQMA